MAGFAEKLAAFLRAERERPFAWGVSDCCLFVADYVRLLEGRDPAVGIRGTYRTEAEAERVLEELGGVPGVIARAGWRRRAPDEAPGIGDLGHVVYRRGGREVELPAIVLGCLGRSGAVYHKGGTGGVCYSTRAELRGLWARGV